MSDRADAPAAAAADRGGRVLAVHLGHAANCSSVGSVVDVLFVSGVIGSAVLAALAIVVARRETPDAAPPAREPAAPTGEGSDEGPR